MREKSRSQFMWPCEKEYLKLVFKENAIDFVYNRIGVPGSSGLLLREQWLSRKMGTAG